MGNRASKVNADQEAGREGRRLQRAKRKKETMETSAESKTSLTQWPWRLLMDTGTSFLIEQEA